MKGLRLPELIYPGSLPEDIGERVPLVRLRFA
ncbi:hypothetical protein EV193_101597 [Herbihabitans rhizosphaerae]|uniref:Uncharacterized protein n=1 Tax=Herbihabitans rhizosphaerae TaxID=1872711 RepID=A0A4Q7L763_9PSEU|nr:hypothetical protein EV193_101597 [Herbihabitans rhizosphaerae]